jgi:general stress protein CsbA
MTEILKDRVTLVLAAVLLLLVLLEASVIPHYHPEFWFHHVPGYSAVIGLFGCIVVVLLSKWLGKMFLQRPASDD